jgi:hypothetical protein
VQAFSNRLRLAKYDGPREAFFRSIGRHGLRMPFSGSQSLIAFVVRPWAEVIAERGKTREWSVWNHYGLLAV